MAERLARLGVGPGERVAVVAPNASALVAGIFGAWRAGAVAVPLSARLREFELRRVLGDATPTAVVSVREHGRFPFAEVLARLGPGLPTLRGGLLVDALGRVDGELPGTARPREAEPLGPEIALVLYTSGTTGEPKGALAAHAPWARAARTQAALLGLGPEDVTALVVPVAHAFGLGCLLAGLVAGSAAVLVDATTSFAPLRAALERHRVGVLHGAPALFAGLLKGGPLGSSVRTGFVAGAPCPPELLARLDAGGARILNLYGMTELGAAVSCIAEDPPEVRYTTVGRPLPGFAVRIREDELQVRGDGVTPGYLGRPEATAAAFDGPWLRTGDLASMTEEGVVSVFGRAGDVVQVAGFNVFPAEVETFLLTHPDVAQATVVGVPREGVGEVLQAFVVPRAGAALTPADVVRFARAGIAGYKVPYTIEILPELPLLASGKPDRRALAGTGGR